MIRNNGNGSFDPAWQGRLGLVTDVVWHNTDEDEALELIAVGDWMSPKVLDVVDQEFAIKTLKGAENLNGFWKTIEIADVNDDGADDILLGNLGENTKFKASEAQPIYLYLDDFDENEQLDPIIFYNFLEGIGHSIPKRIWPLKCP